MHQPKQFNFRQWLEDNTLSFSNNMGKIPAFVFKHSWATIFGFILIFITLCLGITYLKLDHSLEAFFPQKDPSSIQYNIFKKVFGSDISAIILYEPKDGDIFSPKSLSELKKLEDDLNDLRLQDKSSLNRITRTQSIISVKVLESKGDTLISKPFIGHNLPTSLEESEQIRQRAFNNKDLKETFFSLDSRYGLIVLETDYAARVMPSNSNNTSTPSTDNNLFEFYENNDDQHKDIIRLDEMTPENFEPADMSDYFPFISGLESALAKHNWRVDAPLSSLKQDPAKEQHMQAVLNGTSWLYGFFYHIIHYESTMYLMLCILIIIVALYFAFGNFCSLLWPTIIIIPAVIATVGTIGWIGASVTIMIIIVALLILVVGVATAVHILSGYHQKRRGGTSNLESLSYAYKKSGLSVLLANVTTILGLLSLLSSSVRPIFNFAWFSALGITYTFIGTIFLLPALFKIWHPSLKTVQKQGINFKVNAMLVNWLGRCVTFSTKYPYKMMSMFAVLTIIFATGIPKVEIDSNFKNMVAPGNGFRESILLMDKYFGGTMNMEILIDTGKQNGTKDPRLLQAMDKLEQKILTERPNFVKRTVSLVKVTKDSYQKLTDNSEKNYIIPDDPAKVAQVLTLFDSADPKTRSLIVDDNWQIARLTLIGVSKGSSAYVDFIEDIKTWANDTFSSIKLSNGKTPKIDIIYTGEMPLMMKLMQLVSKTQMQSFIIALVVICFLLFFVYGSIKFGLLALLPNLFPMIVILGTAGWFGFHLDADTLLVIPITIGIVVDDTIHFLTHYRTALLQGKEKFEAIYITAKEVGIAMTLTSIILSGGFLSLLLTMYIPFNYFGILSALAISSALFADLMLLPPLLVTFNVFCTSSSTRKKAFFPYSFKITVLALLVGVFILVKPNISKAEVAFDFGPNAQSSTVKSSETLVDDFDFSIEVHKKEGVDQAEQENLTPTLKEQLINALRLTLNSNLGVQTGHPFRLVDLGPSINTILDWKNSFGLIYLENTSRYNFAYDIAKDSDFIKNKYSLEHILREFYWKKSFKSLTLTAGKQIVVWGKGDFFSPINIMSPLDLSSSFFAKPEETRLGQTAIRLDGYKNNDEVNLLLVVVPELNRINQEKHPYSITQGPFLSNRRPKNAYEVAARWSHQFEQGSFGIAGGNVYHRDPLLSSHPTLKNTLTNNWTKYNFIGTASTYVIDPLLFKLELFYSPNQPYQMIKEFDPIGAKKQETFKAMFGVDWNHNKLGFFVLEFLLNATKNNDNALGSGTSILGALGWNKNFLNDDLSVNFAALFFRKPINSIFRLNFNYKIDDYWSCELQYTLFSSDQNDLEFSTLKKLNRFDFRISYSI